jgi:hypothetical protein
LYVLLQFSGEKAEEGLYLLNKIFGAKKVCGT